MTEIKAGAANYTTHGLAHVQEAEQEEKHKGREKCIGGVILRSVSVAHVVRDGGAVIFAPTSSSIMCEFLQNPHKHKGVSRCPICLRGAYLLLVVRCVGCGGCCRCNPP